MNTEDYVSYPLALALKKAGFDEPCDHYWYKAYANSDKMEMRQASADDYNNDDWSVPHCSAPHIYQAQKWLREKKRMVIVVTPETDMADFNDIPKEFLTGEWCYEIWVDDDTHRYGMESHSSYEQSLSAGIEAALELIGEKGE